VAGPGSLKAFPASRFVVLAWLPMVLAGLGALLDERRNLGFTNWRSACRAAGFSISSITAFTLELLPLAIAGALLGGLVVLAGGLVDRAGHAHGALAAHLGCTLAMPAGLLLCASPLPLSTTLVMEVALAGAITWGLLHVRRLSSVRLRTRDASRA
jgi:hypothetical protein